MRSVSWAIALTLLCACAMASGKPGWSPEYEKKVGQEAAAQILKQYDKIDDPQAIEKLQKMADVIGSNTARPEVKYEILYVKEKKPDKKPEENAFSLPGGIIFVTQGLVQAVSSDHELAGVMAHEITHNVNYDGLTQANRAEKIFKGEMAAVLAAIVIGGLDSEMWATVMQAGIFYRQGVLGGYSIEMEKRADEGAVQAMLNTPWDPVGLLTFMERLAAEERRKTPIDYGIYQTHPLSMDRVTYLIDHLQRASVPINRRKTTKWEPPTVKEGQVGGKPAQIVVYQNQDIFACAPDAKERATEIAGKLQEALAKGAQAYHFTTETVDGKPAVVAYDDAILTVEEADATLAGKTPNEVALGTLRALRRGLMRERFSQSF